ncbi:hypothetical protein CK203_089304 [Vitis vinifera]|uniref:Reverse transcriptase zinc-binding domain-containing protein n=1 Tax=Vitis vinifera TaxID=29760 RepID=A0A438BSZ7_VITVI|nr:hypothetical protein CK203_089304 [Vitis vinifera]
MMDIKAKWIINARLFVWGLWKAIRKEWNYLSGRLAYQVGNGQRVRFWMDKWCGDEPLCKSFPSLFTLSSFKEAWVLDVWNPEGD